VTKVNGCGSCYAADKSQRKVRRTWRCLLRKRRKGCLESRVLGKRARTVWGEGRGNTPVVTLEGAPRSYSTAFADVVESGRHASLRNWCLRAYGFESCHRHRASVAQLKERLTSDQVVASLSLARGLWVGARVWTKGAVCKIAGFGLTQVQILPDPLMRGGAVW
jgi:hypothetical protein